VESSGSPASKKNGRGLVSGARRAAAQEDAQAPDTEFRPNLVNTVCFLVQFIVMLVTFAVNYQARRACGSISTSFIPPKIGGICTLQNFPAASGWQSIGPALFCHRLALRMAAHDALGTRSSTSSAKPIPPYCSVLTIARFSRSAALNGWPCARRRTPVRPPCTPGTCVAVPACPNRERLPPRSLASLLKPR